MNTTLTAQTRMAAYADVVEKTPDRRSTIFALLERNPRGLTAEEIADVLVLRGDIPYFDMNFVRPRLTELKRAGRVKTEKVRVSKRTGKNTAVWAVADAEA